MGCFTSWAQITYPYLTIRALLPPCNTMFLLHMTCRAFALAHMAFLMQPKAVGFRRSQKEAPDKALIFQYSKLLEEHPLLNLNNKMFFLKNMKSYIAKQITITITNKCVTPVFQYTSVKDSKTRQDTAFFFLNHKSYRIYICL